PGSARWGRGGMAAAVLAESGEAAGVRRLPLGPARDGHVARHPALDSRYRPLRPELVHGYAVVGSIARRSGTGPAAWAERGRLAVARTVRYRSEEHTS